MSIQYIKGNLLESNCDYICHQVNCMGKMNSGIAKAIREKWPVIFKHYKELCDSWHAWAHTHYLQAPEQHAISAMLGIAQLVPISETQTVINLFGQGFYGYNGMRYTSYDAFWMGLGQIRNTIPKGSKIGFPCKIGCCRGGANWIVIRTMIEEVLSHDFDVYIYEYNGG